MFNRGNMCEHGGYVIENDVTICKCEAGYTGELCNEQGD